MPRRIIVADSDILSIFGKVGAVRLLKRLFEEIYVPPAVYEELRRAKEIGFEFVDELMEHISIQNLSEDEYSEFVQLVEEENYLHSGELQGIVLCKHRNGVLLTNDRRAKDFCKMNNIVYFDLKGILRVFYKKRVLKGEEIRNLVSEIEEKDNTGLKDFEDVFV
jgi:predicted nucleic acid-binding protein